MSEGRESRAARTRHPPRRWAAILLATMAALAFTACSDRDATTPELASSGTIPQMSNGVQDAFGYETMCMEDVVEAIDGTNAVPLNCSAKDMNLFFTEPSGGGSLPLCLPGDPLGPLSLEAHVSSSANERFDIGLWIRTDQDTARDALRGDCRHWSLVPISTTATPAGDTLRYAPFFDADGDQCGDLQQGIQSVLTPITLTGLTCQDRDSDGYLDIGACVAYDNNANTAPAMCNDPALAVGSTRPNTKSKCRCAPINVPVRIAGRIVVKKVTVPAGDAQLFAFSGDLAGSIAHGDSLHMLVEAGTYTTTEAVTPGFDLTAINCSTGGSGVVATRTATFNVLAGQTVTCTFTNTKQASVTIRKVTVPAEATPAGTFTFTQNFDASGSFTLRHDSTKVFNNVVAGVQKTVMENDPTPGYDLTGITCTGASVYTGTPGTRTLLVTPQAGEVITCTFTNTRRGTAIVKKVMQGGTATFTYTGTPSGSIAANNGTITANNLVPGPYSSVEAAAPGWELLSVTCDDANSTGSAITRTASFNIEAGETVTCTFTNRRYAVLVVEKYLVGGGTMTFDFSRTSIANFTLGDGQNNSSGRTLAPNTYRVCELELAVAWMAAAALSGDQTNASPTLINPDAPSDLGNRCVDVTLAAGDSVKVLWTNTPPPGGDARTIGYWRNWSSCSNGKQYEKAMLWGEPGLTLDGNLPQWVGDLNVTTCETGVLVLAKRDLAGRNMASDAAYNMAAQLLAAKLNISAGAGSCTAATDAIAAGQQLLDDIDFIGTGQYLRPGHARFTEAQNLAALLDSYNNNTLCP